MRSRGTGRDWSGPPDPLWGTAHARAPTRHSISKPWTRRRLRVHGRDGARDACSHGEFRRSPMVSSLTTAGQRPARSRAGRPGGPGRGSARKARPGCSPRLRTAAPALCFLRLEAKGRERGEGEVGARRLPLNITVPGQTAFSRPVTLGYAHAVAQSVAHSVAHCVAQSVAGRTRLPPHQRVQPVTSARSDITGAGRSTGNR